MAGIHLRGALVVFEGLDRSGKSTQCQRLCKHLESQGEKVKYMKFPGAFNLLAAQGILEGEGSFTLDRSTPIGKSIDAYLKGEAQQEDHVIHLLFSANRWEAATQMRADIEAGITLIVDRYYMSGIVYSAAKNRSNLGSDWAKQPEAGLPKEDLLIFLDNDIEDLQGRGGYGGEVYENTAMQKSVSGLFYDLLAERSTDPKAVVLRADKSITEVELEVQATCKRHLTNELLKEPLGVVRWK